MNTFDRAMTFILEHEGDVSDHQDDTGGLTRYGISQAAYPDLDIRKLTQADALKLYKRDYWDKCKCGEMPSPIAILVMDSAVNQGPKLAAQLLQKALGVRTDGVIGPQTLRAVQQAFSDKSGLSRVVTELVARRMLQYGLHPKFGVFGLGWSRRLAACHYFAMERT